MKPIAEIWRAVLRFPESYEVSNYGRVRSIQRVVPRSNGKPLPLKSRIMRPHRQRQGYLEVALSRANKSKIIGVHVLVAEAFLGPRPDRHEVNHKNSDKGDNRAVNLEWLTRRDNIIHGIRNGGRKVRFTDRDVRIIRAAYARGVPRTVLAKKYRVHEYSIFETATKRLYAYVA